MTMTETPKYLIYPPQAVLPLYPSAINPIKGRVILVEGIFDTVNLFDKGLTNSICCFGTRNVDKEKLSILKMQNIVGLDIIFDGDEAGQTAAEDIKNMGEALGMLVRNINLGNNIDPGSLGQQQVNNLRERLYK